MKTIKVSHVKPAAAQTLITVKLVKHSLPYVCLAALMNAFSILITNV